MSAPTLLRLAAPLVVSFWMRAAVTFVDTIYAAWYGDAAVAAVGLAIPLEFLMTAVWVGLSSGLTSNLSRAIGTGQHAKVEQYLAVGRRCVWAMTPLFALVGGSIWFVAPHLNVAPEVARGFQIYGTVLIGGSSLTLFWSILPDSLVKAHQDTRSTMWAGIATNVINLGLNTWFMFGLGWGLWGIALSTVLGRLGGLVYALHRAAGHERRRRADPGDWSLRDPAPGRAVLGLAAPASATFSLMAVETALVNGLLATTRHATEAIAAYSIYYRVLLFALQPVIATSVAMLPYAAHRLGAGDVGGVRHALRQTRLASTAYSLIVVAPLIALGGPWLAASLAETEVTARLTKLALAAVPLACLAGAPFLMARPVFEAMQRGRPGLGMAVLRYLLLAPLLAWTGARLAEGLGQPALAGIILGTLAAAALTSSLFILWLGAVLRLADPA